MFPHFQGAPGVATLSSGAPIGVKTATLTAGVRGPILLQDINCELALNFPKNCFFISIILLQVIDELAHFDRERIPERVVHAKGAGAFGHLEITHDITKYTSAKVFEKVGKRTVSRTLYLCFDKSELTDKNFKFLYCI